jgi:hypothetical protein
MEVDVPARPITIKLVTKQKMTPVTKRCPIKIKLATNDTFLHSYTPILPRSDLFTQASSIAPLNKSQTRVSKNQSDPKNSEKPKGDPRSLKKAKSDKPKKPVSKNEAAVILSRFWTSNKPIELILPLLRADSVEQRQPLIAPTSSVELKEPIFADVSLPSRRVGVPTLSVELKKPLFADFSLPSHRVGSFAYHVARELYEGSAEERLRFKNTTERFDWKAYRKSQREAEVYHQENFEVKNLTPTYHFRPLIDSNSKEYLEKREAIRLKKKQLDAKNKAKNLTKARKIEKEQTEIRNALKPKVEYWNALSYPDLVKEFNLLHQPKCPKMEAAIGKTKANGKLTLSPKSKSRASVAKKSAAKTPSPPRKKKVQNGTIPSPFQSTIPPPLSQSILTEPKCSSYPRPKTQPKPKSRATVTKKVKKPKVKKTVVIPSVNTVQVPVSGKLAMANGIPLQGLSRYSPYGTRFSATLPNGEIIESFISGDLKVRKETSLKLVLHAGEMQQLETGLEFVKLNPHVGAAELLGCIRDLKLDINYRKGGEVLLHKEAGNFFKRVQEYGAKKYVDPTFLSW